MSVGDGRTRLEEALGHERDGVRNHRVSVAHGMSGYFAVMLADYEDMDWSADVVSSGVGRYRDREKAVKEGKEWAAAEGLPFVG